METKERKGPITGKEGAEIEVKVAADWTKNHRSRNPKGIISQFFGVEILDRILKQPDCLGIRIYYANAKPLTSYQKFIIGVANRLIKSAKADGEVHLILTGVTAEGMDQIPRDGKVEVATDVKMFKTNVATANTAAPTVLAEQSMPCPGGAGCPQNALTGHNN